MKRLSVLFLLLISAGVSLNAQYSIPKHIQEFVRFSDKEIQKIQKDPEKMYRKQIAAGHKDGAKRVKDFEYLFSIQTIGDKIDDGTYKLEIGFPLKCGKGKSFRFFSIKKKYSEFHWMVGEEVELIKDQSKVVIVKNVVWENNEIVERGGFLTLSDRIYEGFGEIKKYGNMDYLVEFDGKEYVMMTFVDLEDDLPYFNKWLQFINSIRKDFDSEVIRSRDFVQEERKKEEEIIAERKRLENEVRRKQKEEEDRIRQMEFEEKDKVVKCREFVDEFTEKSITETFQKRLDVKYLEAMGKEIESFVLSIQGCKSGGTKVLKLYVKFESTNVLSYYGLINKGDHLNLKLSSKEIVSIPFEKSAIPEIRLKYGYSYYETFLVLNEDLIKKLSSLPVEMYRIEFSKTIIEGEVEGYRKDLITKIMDCIE